jgi:hypothetical protein
MTRCANSNLERKDISMNTLMNKPNSSQLSMPQQPKVIPESSPQQIHGTRRFRIMISKREIKYHATRMGIATGNMPNMELLWMKQSDDGESECFGRVPDCMKPDCSWQHPCRQFMSFVYGQELGGRFVHSVEEFNHTLPC